MIKGYQVIQEKVKPRVWNEFPKGYQFVKNVEHGPDIPEDKRVFWTLVNERGHICLVADSLELLKFGFSYRYPILPTDPDYDSAKHGSEYLLFDNVIYRSRSAYGAAGLGNP